MNIEKLIAKFNVKGKNYEPTPGGNGLLSVEEQIAAVGLAWKQSPVGFLVLFVEYLHDKKALNQLYQATVVEASIMMEEWKGPYAEKALEALTVSAIAEATQQYGQVCPECNGSGKYTSKCQHVLKCPCCDGGRIGWTEETRFAYFCHKLPVTYSRFHRYQKTLVKLVVWLTDQRTAAALALQGQLDEEMVA